MNTQLFLLINHFAGHSKILDELMVFCARYTILIIPILILYFWFKRGHEKKYKILAIFIFLAVTASLLVSWTIPFFYYHPRPLALHLGTALMSHPLDSSFPSDHTVAMFALAFTFWYLGEKKWGIILSFLALLVGLARVFCGVHFPMDIGGSFIVAWTMSAVIFYFYREKYSKLFNNLLSIFIKA